MSKTRTLDSAAGSVAGTQTIARALAVLAAIRDAPDDLGISEIARALDLHMSTTHRIVRALVAAGYATQSVRTERYRLGHQAFLLGRIAGHALGFDAALPQLERLADVTGESVNLVIREGDHGLVVLRVESQQPLRYAQPVGSRLPLYCTSTGKVLLAFSRDMRHELVSLAALKRLTSNTITSRHRLLAELEKTRLRGFAINQGERNPGVCGVAAPAPGPEGAVTAALAVQGPQLRIPLTRVDELGKLVVAAAREVASTIPDGYRL